MSITDRAKRHDVPLARALRPGPRIAFLGSAVGIAALWILAGGWVQRELVIPLVTTATLALATAFALLAWRHRAEDPTQVTYGDVAGALVLVGLCAAATIEPDNLVRVVLHGPTER
ncbi:MAG TPA: hypothetical protein VNK48_14260 [Xanthobacteraceae bacterium]|nr:hypothetical protein [Xanthobacteraceae bacterium]